MDPLLCRICLSRTGTTSIFNKGSDNIQHSMKIMQLVTVTISEDDGLPNQLCEGCVNELCACYQFVMKCEASDKALRCFNGSRYCNDQIKNDEDIKLELDSPEYQNDFSLDDSPQNITEDTTSVCDTRPALPKKRRKKPAVSKKNKIGRNKIGPVQCVICGQVATSPSALETHVRIHTGEKPFSCEVCKAPFRTRGSLKRHFETFHSKRERKFVCEMCGNSFYRKNDIITHLRVHTGEQPYVCQYCPKKFRQIASMIRHRRTHTGEKPYACPICGRRFADSNLVRKHQSVHSDERNFQCHLCPKLLKTRTALNVHVNLHTKGKQNFCTICGMAFNMKGNLNNHMKRVHSEKSGKCTICLKTFSDLEVHMRKHTGEKPFVCEVCNAAFALKRCLAHHMLFKHENSAKYKCSIGECTKTFPTATMLEFHLLKQHTNHTPYVCQHCSRGFFRASDLSRHLRVSHMDVPKAPLKSLTLKLETTQFT
ncbi:uncharacterized protein [Epargyreus clarus]|uniref:uncharacterized protein n=1 Tax=Epargyreus clarus TaxID=520877 RepID=UPI003C2B26D6